MPKPKDRDATRDFLLRGFPVDLADKLKTAAALHGQTLRAYLQALLEDHVHGLERKGIKLTLVKGRADR